jgi:hypothetical protein
LNDNSIKDSIDSFLIVDQFKQHQLQSVEAEMKLWLELKLNSNDVS